MDDFQRFGFSYVPESSGNNIWKVIIGFLVFAVAVYFIVQVIQKSVNKTLAIHNAQVQAPYKPVEVSPGWYIVRGFSGQYTKERLQELGLWIEG